MVSRAKPAAREMVCNFSAIRHASRHMTRYYDACLARLGLRANQYSVLRLVYHNDGISIALLAALTVMDRTTVGRAIQPLQRDGLLLVEVDPADRRSRLLRLTDAGLEVVRQGHAIWTEAQHAFEDKFGLENARRMRASMVDVIATELVM